MSNSLTLSRTYPYSVEQVYEKYSNADALARWWGPHGFTNHFELFDFHEGGKWMFTMRDVNKDYYNEIVFHKIEKNHIIMEHIVEPVFTLEVLFEIIEENETKMTWNSTFASEEFLTQMRDFLIEKNNENFDRLDVELRNF